MEGGRYQTGVTEANGTLAPLHLRSSPPRASSVVPPTSSGLGQASSNPPDSPGPGGALPNAFDAAFLERLDECLEGDGDAEPPTAAEADFAGPWRIEPMPEKEGGGFGLYRAGESLARGFEPHAWFASLSAAQLIAALLPGLARDTAYRLRPDREERGFALESREAWGAVIGHVDIYDSHLVDALAAADGLMRSPWALSFFLEACGKVALERAGAILEARLARKP